jgi:hypothetical protein
MVVDRKALFTRRYMIVHNIGAGPKMEDVLFDWKITGHYRYFGPASRAALAPMSKISIHSLMLVVAAGLCELAHRLLSLREINFRVRVLSDAHYSSERFSNAGLGWQV